MAYKDKRQAIIMQNKWQRENMDRINLTMPKGQKDIIKAHADAQGKSVNGFINEAIEEKIKRDKEKETE